MSNKYLFVINTKIASLVSNLVIHHLKLDIRNCYFAISRKNLQLLSEAMLPDNAIFVDDIENLLEPCEKDFDCYRYIACMQHLIKRVTQATGSLELNIFVPGLDDFISHALAASPLCKQLNFIEQGFESYCYRPDYTAYGLDPAVVEAKYSEFFTANPMYTFENTGVVNFKPLSAFDYQGLDTGISPHLINFYRLNRQAFAQVEQQNINHALTLPEEQQDANMFRYISFDLEQVKQDVYQGPLLEVAREYQSDLSKLHVLALDPIYKENPTELDYQIYANHVKSLLARISMQYQAEMLFVRFEEGQSEREREIVIDLLDNTNFYFLVLDDDFNLELELALAPAHQFVLHAISSSLLIYAQTFQQIACECVDLVIRDQRWNQYLNERNYFIKSILASLAVDSNSSNNLMYRHVFLVTSEVALSTSLTLIKQFDLNTEHCYMLTDSKTYGKVSAIFGESQVMSIDDFEVIYEHVNTQSKVIHYLDAATYVNAQINKFINFSNYSLYTDSMDSYLSMQLASHFRCQEVNLIEAGIASAQVNNNFGLEKAHNFFKQLKRKFPQQLPSISPVLQDCMIAYCFRLRKFAFTQEVIKPPMMLINLQVRALRELNLYDQIIVPVDGSDSIHLLVIENNQNDYPFLQQYLADYATILRSIEDRHLSHLYIMLIQPKIEIFNQLKNIIIATGIPCSLYYNIDLFSELFYANKQVRVHTMSPKIAAMAQFAQQVFTLYRNQIPVDESQTVVNIPLRATVTDVILNDLERTFSNEQAAQLARDAEPVEEEELTEVEVVEPTSDINVPSEESNNTESDKN